MFAPSRDEARRFFFSTWHKHLAHAPLSDLEKMTLAVMLRHPEYHAILSSEDRHIDHDWQPEHGDTNPFLHMGMHLAIDEQLSIGQPFGIKELYASLCQQQGDEHDAQHEMMDCLAEMIWQAQRQGAAPDGEVYLACLRGKTGQVAERS